MIVKLRNQPYAPKWEQEERKNMAWSRTKKYVENNKTVH
jgi:hypothetical protein